MLTESEYAQVQRYLEQVRELGLTWYRKHRRICDKIYSVIVCERGDCPMGALIRSRPEALALLQRIGRNLKDNPVLQPLPSACVITLGWPEWVMELVANAADGIFDRVIPPRENVMIVRELMMDILQPITVDEFTEYLTSA